MTSEKQINSNRINSKLGGVKTPEGRAVSRYNAQKHLILRESITEYEADGADQLINDLFAYFQPIGRLEELLVERIALCSIKLVRIQKAESEFIKSALHPKIVRDISIDWTSEVVEEGYHPKINQDSLLVLGTTYSRYETAIENRMFRSIHELERLQRVRNGEVVSPPITADITNLGSFGNT